MQMDYNERNHIVPQSIVKPIDMSLVAVAEADYVTVPLEADEEVDNLTPERARAASSASWKKACGKPHANSNSKKRPSCATG